MCIFSPIEHSNISVINISAKCFGLFIGHHQAIQYIKTQAFIQQNIICANNNTPMATRSLGRPKNRWENDVKNDLNVMRIRNWKDCIQDRHKWKGIVEKAKTFND